VLVYRTGLPLKVTTTDKAAPAAAAKPAPVVKQEVVKTVTKTVKTTTTKKTGNWDNLNTH